MATTIFLVLVVSFAFAAAALDDSCPDAKAIAPCTCDGEGVNCMGKVSLEQIQKAFSTPFKYGGVRSIWIQGTPITSVPANLIGQLKVQEVFVEVNNVTTVDLKFLDGAQQTLAVLSLFGNKIRELDFASFGRFSALYTLNLGQNELTSIPANGFQSYALSTLILIQNKISDIGANAFSRMQNLQSLELGQNQLKTLGPNSFALSAHNAAINLVSNQISEVAATAFNGNAPASLVLAVNQLKSLKYDAFGNLIKYIGHRGGNLEVSGNPFTCSGCDFGWVVDNKQVLSTILLGFLCPDGTTLQQLTRQKIGC